MHDLDLALGDLQPGEAAPPDVTADEKLAYALLGELVRALATKDLSREAPGDRELELAKRLVRLVSSSSEK